MKPYKSRSALKERLWGGQKLKLYNKRVRNQSIGESWETDKDTMPVLIKLIDANDILSVQVHPDDEKANALEGQQFGKTEAWIVLDCEEGAEIVAGIKEGSNKELLKQALDDGTIADYLNIAKVKKGDCIYIPAGTLHSLGKGIVVYEVQQPSDITYRLFDWDRTDSQGNKRELHIEKGLECIDYNISGVEVKNIYEENHPDGKKNVLFQSEYFKTSYVKIKRKKTWSFENEGFTAMTLISGVALALYDEDSIYAMMEKGDTWIVPEEFKDSLTILGLEEAEIIITEAVPE